MAAIVMCAVFLWIFWDVVARGRYFQPNDANLHSLLSWKTLMPGGLLGVWNPDWLGMAGNPMPLLPNIIPTILFPGVWCQVGAYVLNLALMMLAAGWFLRARGVHGWPLALAMLAMGLSGHTITLISAGHLGKLGMMVFALLALAALDRAIGRRSLFYFALAGAAAGAGFQQATDVMFMTMFLVAAFGLFRFVECWPSRTRRLFDASAWKYAAQMTTGGIVLAAFCGLVALSVFFMAFKTVMPGRENVTGEAPERKWEFATNWSLPPEEIIEFVAPGIFGNETGDPKAPYWGRMGQTLGWPQSRQGLANLRQHTVYLGAVQLCLAVLGIVFAVRRRRGVGGIERTTGQESSAVGEPRPAEVFFWAAVWVMAVLLALGRYAPVYRLFYALPYASSIRCPAKFLHVVEIATVVLFAFGMQSLWARWGQSGARALPLAGANEPVPKKRASRIRPVQKTDAREKATVARLIPGGFVPVLAIVGAGFLLAAVWAAVGRHPYFEQVWHRMGLRGQEALLQQKMAFALMRAGMLIWATALLLLVPRWGGRAGWGRGVFGCALLLLVALDGGSVARRYVNTVSRSFYYHENHLIRRLGSDGERFRLAVLAADPVIQRLEVMLPYAKPPIEAFNPAAAMSVVDADYRAFFGALWRQPLRLWQLCNARYVLGTTTSLGPLLEQPAFEAALAFRPFLTEEDALGTQPVATHNSSHLLLMNRSALPRAVLYFGWEPMGEEATLERLADPQWSPWRTALVPASLPPKEPGLNAQPVGIQEYRWNRIVVRTLADDEAVLVLNDRYADGWGVRVDGAPADMLRCNGIMRGVRLSKGAHEVVFRYRSPYTAAAWTGFGAYALLALWTVGRCWGMRRSPRRQAL